MKVMEAPVVARRSAVSAPAAQGAPAHSPLLVSGLPSYLTEDKVRGHKPLPLSLCDICVAALLHDYLAIMGRSELESYV